jgi:hypothetical protein
MEELSRLEALGMAGAALIVEPGTFPQTLGTGIAIEFEKARNSFRAFRVKLAAEMVRTNASLHADQAGRRVGQRRLDLARRSAVSVLMILPALEADGGFATETGAAKLFE